MKPRRRAVFKGGNVGACWGVGGGGQGCGGADVPIWTAVGAVSRVCSVVSRGRSGMRYIMVAGGEGRLALFGSSGCETPS